MSGLRGSTGWVLAGVTSAAALALCACGGSGYRAEHAPERAAETCSAAETVTACEQRLQGYARQLDALVGAVASAPAAHEAPAPSVAAAPSEELPATPEAAAPVEVQSAGAADASEADQAEEPAGRDCAAARDLRDRICELAAAICELAARSDAAPETKTTCDSSRTSCEQARTRVAAACPD